MMKRQKSTLLAGLMMVSLVCSNATAKAGKHDGFVAGMCAAGAALLGVAGAVALADWCFSETDDQMIARIDAQCCTAYTQYNDAINYFECLVGGGHMCDVLQAYDSEVVLHDFATYVWNKNITQRDYRSEVLTVKESLQSSVQTLRKRVTKLERKSLSYQDEQRLRTMRQLLKKSEILFARINWLACRLESRKDYFNLYDAIDVIRSKYLQEISILESRTYTTETEIKRSILNRDNGQYAFRTFVIKITSDISDLESKIRSLKHGYDAKRQYAQMLVNYMVTIKNIVVHDVRYQQELYAWEQAELQRMRIEAERLRAQVEQDRVWAEQRKVNAMREQNRIDAERNRIERERLYNQRQQCQCNDTVGVNVNIDLLYSL